MIRLNIDGKEVSGHFGDTILDVASANGIDIPTLCQAQGLEPYASCGICVVEAEGMPRLLRACSTLAADAMIISTRSEKVLRSRRSALDLLLSNHTGDCKAPCSLSCPGGTDCQGYVGLIANGQYKEAVELIREQLPLPSSIGRVCPHPCETACRRQILEEPINILGLKRFAGDLDLFSDNPHLPEAEPATGKRVAVVGGGPGGLTCAYYLTKYGHAVTVFDAMPRMGGMLRYGIPEYRLPKDILDREIGIFSNMGIELKNNTRVGPDISLDFLKAKFDAVYIAVGAWASVPLGSTGEDLEGVYGGIDFLRETALRRPVSLGKRVIVVGGGNTAMDSCRTAVRLGAEEVFVAYRRTRDEMPAEKSEIDEAIEEGVVFRFLLAPIEVVGQNGMVSGMRFQKMRLGEPDDRGRRSPLPVEGETDYIEADSVIVAIGQSVAPLGLESLTLTRRGAIEADENTFATSIPGVYAGGDAVNRGPGIAIEAIGQSKKAAMSIHRYLLGEAHEIKPAYYVKRENLTEADFPGRAKQSREKVSHENPAARRENFAEVAKAYTEDEAKREANRCLECGCQDYFECRLIKYANEYGVSPDKYSGIKSSRRADGGHPYLDTDKCILCGLCVRVCEERIGAGALGLVGRGFSTVVSTAPGLSLAETECISCGACVSLCPTGALTERMDARKPVPVSETHTATHCSMCSVGCPANIASKGNDVLRILPLSGNGLCASGKFGFEAAQYGDRITASMIREGGGLKPVPLQAAINFALKKSQAVQAKYGGDALGVSVSEKLSCEELYAISKCAESVFGTKSLFCPGKHESGLEKVLGSARPTTRFDELSGANLIVSFVPDLMERFTPLGVRIRDAVRSGRSELITVAPRPGLLGEISKQNIPGELDAGFINRFIKALIDENFTSGSGRCEGFDELAKALENIRPCENALGLARSYGGAKKAIIIYEPSIIPAHAAAMLVSAASITGHIGRPREGVIELMPECNSQGLTLMGIPGPGSLGENIRGMFAFGGNPGSGLRGRLEFLAVCDTHMTESALAADVVLPAASFAESAGTFVSSEGRILRRPKSVEGGFDFWHMLQLLGLGARGFEDVSAELVRAFPDFAGEYVPAGRAGKSRLEFLIDDGPLFDLSRISQSRPAKLPKL